MHLHNTMEASYCITQHRTRPHLLWIIGVSNIYSIYSNKPTANFYLHIYTVTLSTVEQYLHKLLL